MRKILLTTIRQYQRTAAYRKILMGQFFPFFSTCRYLPTCSEYTHEAILKYGIIKGLLKGTIRFASCNPLGGHGYKPLT